MVAREWRGRDLTQGPIASALLLFAIPTLASNILQSLNGSINAIWVGRFLGAQALAATANANITMFLMFSVVFGFGMASTVMIAPAGPEERRGGKGWVRTGRTWWAPEHKKKK